MSETNAREEILGDIKRALRHDQASAKTRRENVPLSSSQLDVSDIQKDCSQRRGELIAEFEAELRRIRGHFYRAATADAACQYIEQVAIDRQAKAVVGWDALPFDDRGLSAMLAQRDIAFENKLSAADVIASASAADIGLSGVDYALADTGTLVLLAGNGRPRSISLLPPVHIAVVRPDQVLSGLNDLFPILRSDAAADGKALTSAITFITGPSRTADIELTLVVGVHGPQELHVVLLD